MPDPFGFREAKNSLTEEERKKYIADPGTPWKTWLLTEGLKTWIGLAMLILDIFLYGTLWLTGNVYARYAIIPAMIGAVYLNYLLWIYLWRVPDIDELRKGRLKRTLRSPFPVGRWTLEYKTWKEQGVSALHSDEINPKEFL
jgi:hypothetical protein